MISRRNLGGGGTIKDSPSASVRSSVRPVSPSARARARARVSLPSWAPPEPPPEAFSPRKIDAAETPSIEVRKCHFGLLKHSRTSSRLNRKWQLRPKAVPSNVLIPSLVEAGIGAFCSTLLRHSSHLVFDATCLVKTAMKQ